MTDEQIAAIVKALGLKSSEKIVFFVDNEPRKVFVAVTGLKFTGFIKRADGAFVIEEGTLPPAV